MTLSELYELDLKKLYKYIKNNILYGFVDKNGNKYYGKNLNDVDIDNLYVLQSPNSILKSNCAWCWDIVELIRDYLNHKEIYNETYYIEYKNDLLNIHQTHTFIIYEYFKKWYNIQDNSSNDEQGIFMYNSKKDAIKSIVSYFKKWLKSIYNINNIEDHFICNKYSKPNYFIGSIEFQNWCKKK